MITKAESNSIEQVQKTGLYLIYGARFRSYTWALHEARMKTQVEQRKTVFEKFTKACLKSNKFSKWFWKSENTQVIRTRSRKVMFKPVQSRTQLYANSPIPQMVALANKLKIPENMTLKLKSGKIVII